MNLQDVIDEMEEEIVFLKDLLNNNSSDNIYKSRILAKRLTISKYLHMLKFLNEETLRE